MNMGCSYVTFRLVWRTQDEALLTQHWQNITQYQDECDKIVGNVPAISFFVSAITGVYNKSARKGVVSPPSVVYPAVGYWLVSEQEISQSMVAKSLAGLCHEHFGAEIKFITPAPASHMDMTCSAVCSVLKDHANGYISKRVEESRLACNRSEPVVHFCKVIVLDEPRFKDFLSDIVDKLVARNVQVKMRDF